MEYIAIGIDASKGRADIAIINQSGTVLRGSGGYDDTWAGQDRLTTTLRELRQLHPEARLIAGVEATGGCERTWVAFFQRQKQAGRPVALHRLNPLAVKRFLESDLHRKVNDQRAAEGIARFLLERRRQNGPQEIPLDGTVTFYRTIRGLIMQRSELILRFHALLGSAQPELVQFCRNGVPNWVLLVCRQYPTAAHLARARIATLAKLPHVNNERAARLKAAAKTSTAAMVDAGTAAAMTLLTEELLHRDARIADLQGALIDMLADDRRFRHLQTIPGIGAWSAAALCIEIGDPTRFTDVRQLVAWAGLDPREDTSGDSTIKRGISHRGNGYLRAILFPLAMAAMQHHPVVGAFIARKINEGKPKKVALLAGGTKILRIAFAIMVTGKPYDPDHEARRAKPDADQRQAARATTPHVQQPEANDLSAPVSAAEARKRRARQAENAPAPQHRQHEVEPQPAPRADAPPPSRAAVKRQEPLLQQAGTKAPPRSAARRASTGCSAQTAQPRSPRD